MRGATTLAAALLIGSVAHAAPDRDDLTPSSLRLTPLAAPGARLLPLGTLRADGTGPALGWPAAMGVSPDGHWLAVVTSGFNGTADTSGKPDLPASQEAVLLYAVGSAGLRKVSALRIPNTFNGLAWSPDSRALAVSGGVDDSVRLLRVGADGALSADGAPVALGHAAGNGVNVKAAAAGLAWSPDGGRMLVANFYNDSVSLLDVAARKVVAETDLRPGKAPGGTRGQPGGSYPFQLTWTAVGRAVVSAPRDRELIELVVTNDTTTVARRAKTAGEPTALLALPSGGVLAVADNADTLIHFAGGVTREWPLDARLLGNAAPRLRGLNPSALALSPDGRTLYVTLGALNAVAAVDVEALLRTPAGKPVRLDRLAPTGWYPSAVAAIRGRLTIANFKGLPGPNPAACRDSLANGPTAEAKCRASGQYVLQLQAGSLLTMPTPTPAIWTRLTARVRANAGAPSPAALARAEAAMAALRARVKHVVYIIKENRTYDQVLGDLGKGDGEPRLAILPERITPNHHALAREFVTLDRFFDSGEVSATGWSWSTAARAVDLLERITPVGYAGRGLSYEAEGSARNVNVGVGGLAARRAANPATPDDPDLLPGPADLSSPDAATGEAGAGFLWDAALRKGLTVRNYGFFLDLDRYDREGPAGIPRERDPHAKGLTVAYPTQARLAPITDPYFRGFDQRFPDYWLANEFIRDWLPRAAAGQAPRLTLLRLAHDHFGDFATAIDGVNTVERQMADNDYALGRVVEAIANSPAGKDTLIFVLEDDAQNGADHVDAHRSIAFVAGPFVRRGALVSTRYTTLSVLRTIEGVLGLPPLGLFDGLSLPMTDVFDTRQAPVWRFRARYPEPLRATNLPVPPASIARAAPRGACAGRSRDANYWESAMRGQDFHAEDRLDTARFNAALWRGQMGSDAPAARSSRARVTLPLCE